MPGALCRLDKDGQATPILVCLGLPACGSIGSMDWHLLKLFAVAASIALTFGVWLHFFLNAEKPLGFIACGIGYFAMLGVFSSGYLLVNLFDDFRASDVAVITVLAILFIILIYGLSNLLEAWQRGTR